VSDPLGPLLTSEQLYQRDIQYYRKDLYAGTSAEYLERLQAGDRSAKDGFLCSLLPVIRGYAMRLQKLDMPMLELVNVGNHIIVEKLEESLLHPNPIGYLLKFAHRHMLDYCCHFRYIITLPSGPEHQPYEFLPLLDEFDTDEFDIEEKVMIEEIEQDTTPLYQALESIPGHTATGLMTRLYGMQGQNTETMHEIAGGDSTTKKYQAVKGNKMRYLRCMREYLTAYAPEYVQIHTRCIPQTSLQEAKYGNVCIPEVTQRKLEVAINVLQERGETLSMKKLREESGVHTTYASAFLWRLRNTATTQRQ